MLRAMSRRPLQQQTQKTGVIVVFLSLVLLAAGCATKTPSPQAYREQVTAVLRSGELPESDARFDFPGLIAALEQPIQVMGCLEESDCWIPAEFSELRKLSKEAKFSIADSHGKLCDRDDVRPPQSLQAFHEGLCAGLDEIRSALDTVQLTAGQALTALRSDPEQSRSFVTRAAERILSQQDRIISVLKDLQEVDWLSEVFQDVGGRIPELAR